MLTCPRSSLSFHSNAHHHGSLPQQLGMVWDLLLKADPEGPSPIFHAALRHSFHTPTVTPQHVSLQHTMVVKFCDGAALIGPRCIVSEWVCDVWLRRAPPCVMRALGEDIGV